MQSDGSQTLLIVSNDAAARASLIGSFEADYRVRASISGGDALNFQDTEDVDLVLSDQRVADMSGVEFLREMRITHPEAIRILIAGPMAHDEMVRSINEAAVYQIVAAPWNAEHLRLMVKRALESRELARRHRYLSRELKFADSVLRRQNDRMAKLLADSHEFDKMVFASDSMAAVCHLARKASATDLAVLIQGETGTGKELMARAVHFFSARKSFPFLAQNCGALPDELLQSELFGHKRGAFTGAVSDRLGLFPAADGGTVFLDEISDVSPAFQVCLLRFLQEGEVKPLGTHQTRRCSVRIIAASNQNLKDLVEQKKFRRDLYYRLRGFELNIPALRERVEDIPVLADRAAQEYAESLHKKIAGISAETMQRLKAHSFPGNVRELENEVRRMVALASDGEFLCVNHMSPEFDRLTPAPHRHAAPAFVTGQATLKQRVESLEMDVVSQALMRHKWNHSRAARELGLSRVGLANKIRRYKLDREDADP